MRRVVLTVLVFLVLGAVVNVGVAWGLAVWDHDVGMTEYGRTPTVESDAPVHLFWVVGRMTRTGVTRVASYYEAAGRTGQPDTPAASLMPTWARSPRRRLPPALRAGRVPAAPQVVATSWAEPASAPDQAPEREGAAHQEPEHGGVEGGVDGEAVPDW